MEPQTKRISEQRFCRFWRWTVKPPKSVTIMAIFWGLERLEGIWLLCGKILRCSCCAKKVVALILRALMAATSISLLPRSLSFPYCDTDVPVIKFLIPSPDTSPFQHHDLHSSFLMASCLHCPIPTLPLPSICPSLHIPLNPSVKTPSQSQPS